MVSERLRVGGTCDLVAMIGGRRTLLDLKTGKRLYPRELVQIAAYGMLWEELHPDAPIERYSLLRLGKEDAAFTWRDGSAEEMTAARDAFELAVRMHGTMKRLGRAL